MVKEIVLGAVQGLAEFLPISSDGHLVLANAAFGATPDLFYITLLHVGTLTAAALYFFPRIIAYLKDRDMIAKVLVACMVTGAIGLLGKHFFESLFENPMVASACLVANGMLLIAANHVIGKGTHGVGLGDSVWMGLAQVAAILPGVSRSGTTISALAFCGVKKEEAFAFSFISSLPLIAAAFALECKDALEAHAFAVSPAQWIGVGVALAVGLCALKLLELVIKKTRFDLFGYYCIAIGVFSFAMQVSAK